MKKNLFLILSLLLIVSCSNNREEEYVYVTEETVLVTQPKEVLRESPILPVEKRYMTIKGDVNIQEVQDATRRALLEMGFFVIETKPGQIFAEKNNGSMGTIIIQPIFSMKSLDTIEVVLQGYEGSGSGYAGLKWYEEIAKFHEGVPIASKPLIDEKAYEDILLMISKVLKTL